MGRPAMAIAAYLGSVVFTHNSTQDADNGLPSVDFDDTMCFANWDTGLEGERRWRRLLRRSDWHGG
jgi:hypothetical protein